MEILKKKKKENNLLENEAIDNLFNLELEDLDKLKGYDFF